jgi:hypothetical protein
VPGMRHLKAGEVTFIEIKLPKGCILLLSPQEYDRAIARGKAKRRREAFERRLQAMADGRMRDRALQSEEGT